MIDNYFRIRFVNPKTGEEATAELADNELAWSADGGVIEYGGGPELEFDWWPRPDLRAEIVQPWIPVGERLPEAGRYVKVRNEFRDEMVMQWCSDPDGQQCWETRDGHTAIPSFVIEWRPLTSEESR